MDPIHFDRLIRAFSDVNRRTPSRRSLLYVLGGGLVAGLAPAVGSDARRKKKHKKHHGGGGGGGGGGDVPAPKPVPAGPRKVIGYYVGYERDDMPPDEIEWDAMTHIAVGTVLPRSNGSLDFTLDLGSESEGKALARDLARRARDNGVVPLLMIGGAGAHDGFKRAAADNLTTFVDNLVNAMNDLGFAGLDLDWEPMEGSDEKPFKDLVFSLRSALPDAVLTVPADATTLTFPDVPAVFAQVAPFVDLISVMTYNMEGAYEGWDSWHSSALHGATERTPTSVEATVGHFLAAGVPANKLGVGVGFFGDCWSAPVTGPGQRIGGADIVATDSEMSFTRIMAQYYTAGAAKFDTTAQVPYLSYDTGHGAKKCTYITYEDQTSIATKGRWARDQGLNGAIVWTINQGHDRSKPTGQRDALLKATRQAFGA
jgi:chitinase